jgi:hypothetical protein
MSPLAHVHTRALWGRHRTIKTPSLSWAGRTGPTRKLTVLIECYLHYSVRAWEGGHIFFLESQLHCLPTFKTILKTMPPASRPFPLLFLLPADPSHSYALSAVHLLSILVGNKGRARRELKTEETPRKPSCDARVRAHVLRHVSCFGLRDCGFGFRASSAKASQRRGKGLCKGVAKASAKTSHGFASRLFAPVVSTDKGGAS